MAKISHPNWSGKRSKVREKSVKSQGILKRLLSSNPVTGVGVCCFLAHNTHFIHCFVLVQPRKTGNQGIRLTGAQ